MISFFLLLVLLFNILNPNPTSSLSNVPIQIQQACLSSLFPSLCISSLSQSHSHSHSATDLILSAVSVSSQNLRTAQSLSRAVLASSQSNQARKNAAQNCLDHLSLSSARLSPVSSEFGGHSLPSSRALLSAALLYQYDCWSALKYVNGTHRVADAMLFVDNLARLTSNALAMVAALQRYGGDMSRWAPPQTERDGYWADSGGGGDDVVVGFPADLTADVTVCKPRGTCDYGTVQEAVNAVPD